MAVAVSEEKIELKRTLGLFSGCGVIIGTCIGSGIFVSPKGVIMESGSVGLALLIWPITGLFITCGALSFAELGTLIPSSGGPYAFLRDAFGGLPAFIYIWMMVAIVMPSACAVISLTCAYYLVQPGFPDCETPQTAVRLIAACIIGLLTFVNAASVKWAARVQNIFMVLKLFALVCIILGGIYLTLQDNGKHFQDSFVGTTHSPSRVALAVYSGLFSYSGWECITMMTEELKQPQKNLPRAIYISIPIVTVIYVLTNAAYFSALSPAEMIRSEAVAVTFAAKLCRGLNWVMPFLVACSTFGSLNGSLLSTGRMFFVAAREGYLPDFLALINIHTFTPVTTLTLMGAAGIIMLCIGDIFSLINYIMFAISLSFLLCTCALFYFRIKRPHAHRPYKVPLIAPIIFLLVSAFITIMPLVAFPSQTGWSLLIIVSGVPIYLLGVKWKKPKAITKKIAAVTVLVQKVLVAQPQDK